MYFLFIVASGPVCSPVRQSLYPIDAFKTYTFWWELCKFSSENEKYYSLIRNKENTFITGHEATQKYIKLKKTLPKKKSRLKLIINLYSYHVKNII